MNEHGATFPLFDPADFRIGPGIVHFGAAGESPFLRQHDQAFLNYAVDKGRGWPGRIAQEERVESARKRAAQLFHVPVEEIGFVANVAEGMSIVSESIAWRPGDNVCVDWADFPSVVLPFGTRRDPAVELRVAQESDPGRFQALVDKNTRVISIGYVSYLTGERHDLDALRQLADAYGALLIVDFTQAAGVFPVQASVADFAFSACYKFLLGCTGVAIAFWNRRRQPTWSPNTAGWYSVQLPQLPDYRHLLQQKLGASRFSRGNLSYPSVYVLDGALAYLSAVDEAVLAKHVETLADEFLTGLDDVGIPCMTPRDTRRRGPSICFSSKEAQDLVNRLYNRSVVTFNGGERVRFSFHGYNSSADVQRAIEILREEWRG